MPEFLPRAADFGGSPFPAEAKPVGGVGMAAAVLIGISALLTAVSAWSDWHRYNLVSDYVSGGAVTFDELDSADNVALATGAAALVGLVAAGVVFVVWLWRARQNAEILCPARHRRARAWVIWGWICPVVNFWFPYMLVDDVYRASRRDNPQNLYDLRTVPGSPVLGWWWACWVALVVINRFSSYSLGDNPTVDDLHNYAIYSTIGTVVTAGAAVLIIRIMREISIWQASS